MQENQEIQIVSNNNKENKNEFSIHDDSNKRLSTVEKYDLPNEVKDYKITSYPVNCEEFSRINKIIPLRKNKCKFAILIILDIITVFIINLFIAWFPQLNLYLIYDIVPLNEATNIGVYGKDNKLVIEELKNIELPKIDYESSTSVIKHFNMNLSSFTKILFFQFRLYDYIFNYEKKEFEGLKYFIQTQQDNFLKIFTHGLTETESQFQREIYGICDIDIKVHSVFRILLDELTDPFYLFQLYSVILWYCNEYEYYATVIVVLTIISLVVSVYDTHKNLKQLHNMSKYSCDVNVYRKNNNNEVVITKINSENLVPGDLYEIPEDGLAMPADTILVNGTVIINESMLTGESTPIVKVHMPSVDVVYDTQINDSEKYILFAGTKIVQKRSLQNKVLGVVYQTGFKTVKGSLIRAILFPKEGDEKFKTDSTKYIIFMGCLCLVGFAISLKFLIDNAGLSTKDIIMKFLDLITTTVPPSLPACISVGITYSLSRLKDADIFCIARERVNVLGKVNIICFDKTGTLTEDEFELFGYQFTMPNFDNDKNINLNKKNNDNSFDDDSDIILSKVEVSSKILNKIHQSFWRNYLMNNNENYQENPRYNIIYFTECLGCCHGIDKFEDQYLGDSIDKKMFCSVKWMIQNEENKETKENKRYIMPSNLYKITEKTFFEEIKENIIKKEKKINDNKNNNTINSSQYKILIEKIYNFNSESQSMTVITKNILDKSRRIYIKGAPERILEKCTKKSKPNNINELIMNLTKKGLRVIACATRLLKKTEYINNNVNYEINPINIEKGMTFLGLIIFKNPLKKDTQSVIQKLSASKFLLVMSTGDNECTSYYVAQQSKMIDNTIKKRYVFDLEKNNHLYMEIQQVENSLLSTETFYNTTFNVENSNNLEKISEIITKQKAIVSMSGAALNYIIKKLKDSKEKYIDNERKCLKKDLEILIRKFGRIFYRMTPRNKAELIEFYKKDNKSIIIMCGDGSNDIPAILESDIGIAINQKSDMQVLSHFYMNNSSIQCVEIIVKTGRACFESNEMIFKSMILYGIIQTFSLIILKRIKIYKFTPKQKLYSDILCVFIPIIFASKTAPSLVLAKEAIGTSLLNKKFIFSVSAQIFIQITTLILFSWYLNNYVDYKNDYIESKNYIKENKESIFGSYIFLLSSFQYILSIFVFNCNSLHRKHYSTNSLYIVFVLISMVFTLLIITVNGFKNLTFVRSFVKLEPEYCNFEYSLEKNRFVLIIFGNVNLFLSLSAEQIISRKIS